MNDCIIDGITNIDQDLIEKYFATKQSLTVKKNAIRRLRINKINISIAACLMLIIIGLVATVSIINGNTQIVYNSYGKIDIASLPGAQIIDTDESHFISSNGDIYSPEDFMSFIKKSDITVVYGTAKNIKTVKINDWAYSWYITTFEIEVIKEIKNCNSSKTLTVVSASRYKGKEAILDYSMESEIDIVKNITGLFLLKPNSDSVWKIRGKKYQASDFGDYYAMSQYDCDGNSMIYYGTKIDFDDIIGE